MPSNPLSKTLGYLLHRETKLHVPGRPGSAALDAEADALCNAQRYKRSPDRADTGAGYYEQTFHAKAGEVTPEMPKLRWQTFETAIIERYVYLYLKPD